nr:type III-A CRISPR-associated RAMP protein Csm5 [Candidatus Sigynarchaeum springense]
MSTASPVHVGTGQVYDSFEYHLQQGTLIRVDTASMFDLVPEADRGKIIEDPRQLKGYLPRARPRYRLPIKCGRVPGPAEKIRECIKTPGLDPYIPGSTFKGAIRTALLWKVVSSSVGKVTLSIDRSRPFLVNVFETITDGNIVPDTGDRLFGIQPDTRFFRPKQADNMLENIVFGTGSWKDARRLSGAMDAQRDLLKFVIVSDFMPGNEKALALDKTVTRSMRGATYEVKPDISSWVEVATGTFAGSLSLSPQLPAALGNTREYPVLEDRLRVIGLGRDDMRDPVAAERKMADHVLRACKEFADKVVQHEKAELGAAIAHPREAGVRVGFGVGTLYQTVMMLLERQAPELAVSIANRISRPPRRLRGSKIDPVYPKTYETLEGHGVSAGWLVAARA